MDFMSHPAQPKRFERQLRTLLPVVVPHFVGVVRSLHIISVPRPLLDANFHVYVRACASLNDKRVVFF